MSLNTMQLLNIRRQVLADFRSQKHRFTNDIDYVIGQHLRDLKRRGMTTDDLKAEIGSKDYNTLKHYLTHTGNEPLPERMDVLPRVDKDFHSAKAKPHPTNAKANARTVENEPLTNYLTFYPNESKVVAVDVPTDAWTPTVASERPDLIPPNTYSGWANWDSKGRITKTSESKSPLLGENKFGVLTPVFLLAQAANPPIDNNNQQ